MAVGGGDITREPKTERLGNLTKIAQLKCENRQILGFGAHVPTLSAVFKCMTHPTRDRSQFLATIPPNTSHTVGVKICLLSETTYCKGNNTLCCSLSVFMFLRKRKLYLQPPPGTPAFLTIFNFLCKITEWLSKGRAFLPTSTKGLSFC